MRLADQVTSETLQEVEAFLEFAKIPERVFLVGAGLNVSLLWRLRHGYMIGARSLDKLRAGIETICKKKGLSWAFRSECEAEVIRLATEYQDDPTEDRLFDLLTATQKLERWPAQ